VAGRHRGYPSGGEPRTSGVAVLPPLRELALATGLLAVVAAAAYGWFVANGGFYSDDWANAAGYRLAHAPRYWTDVRSLEHDLGGRPILAALLPIPHAVFGVHPALHLAFAVVLALMTTVCFYVLLRVLGIGAFDALGIAVLALLFPWAEAIELWPTASINTVAVIFFFLGVVVAVYGLGRCGRRSALWHVLALSLYLLSVLTYEVAAAAIVLAGILYFRHVPPGPALRRWLADVAVVVGALVYSLTRTGRVRHVGTLHERISDIPTMSRQALSLLASAFVPVGNAGHVLRPLVVLAAAGVIVVAFVQIRQRKRDPFWLIVAAACAVALAAAYFMFLGSYLHPLDPATGTRTNVFARFAYAGLVYAVLATGGQLLLRSRTAARTATLAAIALIAVGYSIHLARDESAWSRAADLQAEVLAAIDARFPHLEPGTTVVTFGAPGQVAPGAPVFLADWDLSGAVQIQRDDSTIQAAPVYERVVVRCAPRAIVIDLPGSRGLVTGRYGRVYFLDVKTRRSARISTRHACRAEQARFRPGPHTAA
jgi:MFS family permease